MYRPNFCAECGERVLRSRWRVWTSRRFCAACAVRLRHRRVAAAAVRCACLVLLGFAFGRALRPKAPPLVVVRGGAAAEGAGAAVGAGGQGAARAGRGPDGATAERPTDPLEVVSLCGARTKKGTPCSRRVRGAGRCWQHRGKPAMLPEEKLMVPG